MRRAGLTLLHVLLTAIALTYISEWLFWSGQPDKLDHFALEWLLVTFAYALPVYFMTLAAQRYGLGGFAPLMLGGAIYGWLLEGIIVQTTYEALPLSLSWTGLAWHALLSVAWGWHWLPRALQRGGWRVWGTLLGSGVLVGLWSVGWAQETDLMPVGEFWVYQMACAGVAAVAYGLRAYFPFDPPPQMTWGMGGLLALYFAVIAVPTVPFALILPPFLYLIWHALRRWQARAPQPAPLTFVRLKPWQTLPLGMIAVGAGVTYTLIQAVGVDLPTIPLAYLILTPAGFITFVWSVRHIYRLPVREAPPQFGESS